MREEGRQRLWNHRFSKNREDESRRKSQAINTPNLRARADRLKSFYGLCQTSWRHTQAWINANLKFVQLKSLPGTNKQQTTRIRCYFTFSTTTGKIARSDSRLQLGCKHSLSHSIITPTVLPTQKHDIWRSCTWVMPAFLQQSLTTTVKCGKSEWYHAPGFSWSVDASRTTVKF